LLILAFLPLPAAGFLPFLPYPPPFGLAVSFNPGFELHPFGDCFLFFFFSHCLTALFSNVCLFFFLPLADRSSGPAIFFFFCVAVILFFSTCFGGALWGWSLPPFLLPFLGPSLCRFFLSAEPPPSASCQNSRLKAFGAACSPVSFSLDTGRLVFFAPWFRTALPHEPALLWPRVHLPPFERICF